MPRLPACTVDTHLGAPMIRLYRAPIPSAIRQPLRGRWCQSHGAAAVRATQAHAMKLKPARSDAPARQHVVAAARPRSRLGARRSRQLPDGGMFQQLRRRASSCSSAPGNIAHRPKQPQADGGIVRRVVADLFNAVSSIPSTPSHGKEHPRHMRRIKQHRRRRSTTAADGSGCRPRWSMQVIAVLGSFTAGEIAQRDIDDLDDAELHVLLQRASGPISKAPSSSTRAPGGGPRARRPAAARGWKEPPDAAFHPDADAP